MRSICVVAASAPRLRIFRCACSGARPRLASEPPGHRISRPALRPHLQRRARGQALVEFAIALPILILLVAGVLELSRGYAVAIATSNAARDGARYAAGKTAATDGPGLTNMCSLITADLASVTSTISCPNLVGHAPPFTSGTDYPSPTAGQAVVAVYCGTSLDCVGKAAPVYESEIDVYVYYGFNDLNLFGGRITISGSSTTKTSW